jgi:hypothetical protein
MSDPIQNEIEEMLGTLQAKAPEEPKEEVVEAKEPEPAKEPVQAEPEPVQETAPKGDVIEEEVEAAAPVKAETVEDPRIAAMQETINQLSSQLVGRQEYAPVAAPAPTQTAPVQQPQVEVDLDKFQILPEGVDFEDIVNDKSTFEKFFRDVLGRYEVSRVRRDALATPTMVSRQVQHFLGLHEAVRNFYDTNKDLAPVKPLVGAFSNKIVAEHPDWSLVQVMDEAAKMSRQALGRGITSPGVMKPVAPVKPSFATTNTSRNTAPKPKTTKLQAEIEDLLTDL